MRFSKTALASLLIVLIMLLSACSGAQPEAPKAEVATISEATSSTNEAKPTESKKSEKASKQTTEKKTESISSITTKASTEAVSKSKETTTSKSATSVTTKQTTTTTTTTTTRETTSTVEYCTLTIDCRDILSNIDDLKAGHSDYVPSSGYILQGYKVKYVEGDTAYDILKKGCKEKGIRINAQSSAFGTYVAGINGLDERDCGPQSGWLYKVNTTSPGISCSKYEVKPNDKVCFHYTCSY